MKELVQCGDGFVICDGNLLCGSGGIKRIRIQLQECIRTFWCFGKQVELRNVTYKDHPYTITVPCGILVKNDITLEVRDGVICECPHIKDFGNSCVANCQKHPVDNFDRNFKMLQANDITFTYSDADRVINAQDKEIKRFDEISINDGRVTVHEHKIRKAFYYRNAESVVDLVKEHINFSCNNGTIFFKGDAVRQGGVYVFDLDATYTHDQFLESFELC